MGRVRDSVQIDAPPEVVFDVVIDARRWREWQTTTADVPGVEGPLDSVGRRYRVVANVGGRLVEAEGRVTQFERPALFEVDGYVRGGGRMISRTTLQRLDGGTYVTIEIEFQLPGGFLAQLAAPLIARQIEIEVRQSARNLKSLVEATALA